MKYAVGNLWKDILFLGALLRGLLRARNFSRRRKPLLRRPLLEEDNDEWNGF